MTETATATKTALAPVPMKAVEPKDLFERLDRIYDAIAHRAFDIFEGNGRNFGHDLENWIQAESELLHPVKVNMTETERTFTVQAEVPGFTAKDLEIQVEPRRLTISGKKETSSQQEKGKAVFQEYHSNEVMRVLDLPVEVTTENVTATLKNGVLELQLPKSSKAKSFRVEVKSA
jgi:HSP20 family protein